MQIYELTKSTFQKERLKKCMQEDKAYKKSVIKCIDRPMNAATQHFKSVQITHVSSIQLSCIEFQLCM